MENYETENVFENLASVDSEQCLLGAVLIEPAAIAKCNALTAEMFYLPQHRMIFQAVRDMASARLPVDVFTVADVLEKKGQSEEIGGLTYLIDLAQNAQSAVNVSRYADIVKNRYTERELLKASAEIEKIAVSRDGLNVDEKCARAVSVLAGVNQVAGVGNKAKSYAEALCETLDYMQKVSELDGGLIGISTGFGGLDAKINGLQDGNLIVIAARPGMGKTVLGENIARAAAKAGKKVHFQSYEMAAREIQVRGMAAEMGIDFGNLKACRLTQSEYDDLGIFTAKAAGWTFSIDDTPLDVDGISLVASDLKMQGGLDLLVIDHLHLVPRKGVNEVAELGDITRKLKRLAMELKIPVLLLAQLNRTVARQGDKRPGMADIRGSGAIEQDANIIIMPHRESYYDENANPNEAELIIAKNRDGETGTVVLGWEGNHQRFTDWINPWIPPEEKQTQRRTA